MLKRGVAFLIFVVLAVGLFVVPGVIANHEEGHVGDDDGFGDGTGDYVPPEDGTHYIPDDEAIPGPDDGGPSDSEPPPSEEPPPGTGSVISGNAFLEYYEN
jgi:hypothetical protein